MARTLLEMVRGRRLASASFALALVWCLGSPALAGPSATFGPYEDPAAVSLAALRTAQQSVDVAQYNIRNEAFADELRALKARGVQVRIVVDAKNAAQPWNTLDDDFEAEGFAIKRFRNTHHAYAIMHHKFCVIDGRQVLTGSFNWNHTAEMVNDENMVSLDDPALIAAYQTEFEELWGTQPETAGVGQGAAGRVYFSPEDHPRDAILDAIRGAQRQVLVAVFSFRDRDVANAMRDAARRGVQVVLVTEKKQADGTREDERVAAAGGRVIVGANVGATNSAMHHKFAVIDDEVVTGACNWTYTAFTHSNEDVLILRDADLVRRYTDTFAALVAHYDAANYVPGDFLVHKPEAGVSVLVRMPNTGVGDRVLLVGADPALGAWDPTQGLELATASGIFPSWTGTVRLPAGSRTACKAVLIRADGTVVWELGGDRAIEVDSDGTDVYSDATFRDEIDVTVEVDHPTLPAGRTLALLGAHTALGAWDETRALPLAPVLSQPGRYTLQVRLPGRTRQTCKLVEVTADGRVLYEAGYDRALELHDQDAPQTISLSARGPAHDPTVASVASTSLSAPAATAPAASGSSATTTPPTTPPSTTPSPGGSGSSTPSASVPSVTLAPVAPGASVAPSVAASAATLGVAGAVPAAGPPPAFGSAAPTPTP